jgi:hypothetical protein
MYTCPMHPEIRQKEPGKCPKCGGMKLVKEGYDNSISAYAPLIVVIGLITLVSLLLALQTQFIIKSFISNFMIGFFLTFSGFKLMDLKGFAKGYSTYDLLAKRWYPYGYIYPFIELFFGLAMIINIAPTTILISEIIIMAFSGVGVLLKLLKHEKFQCACLGTFLKVPLTKITLIEDFGMATMALLMLVL